MYINVLDCGADPHGQHDNTLAFEAAFARAAVSGQVYVPRGTYNFDRFPDIPDYTTIVGDGFSRSILQITQPNSHGISMIDSSHVTLKALWIKDHQDSDSPDSAAIYLANCTAIQISECRTLRFGYGVFSDTGLIWQHRIERSRIDLPRTAGVWFQGAPNTDPNVQVHNLDNTLDAVSVYLDEHDLGQEIAAFFFAYASNLAVEHCFANGKTAERHPVFGLVVLHSHAGIRGCRLEDFRAPAPPDTTQHTLLDGLCGGIVFLRHSTVTIDNLHFHGGMPEAGQNSALLYVDSGKVLVNGVTHHRTDSFPFHYILRAPTQSSDVSQLTLFGEPEHAVSHIVAATGATGTGTLLRVVDGSGLEAEVFPAQIGSLP